MGLARFLIDSSLIYKSIGYQTTTILSALGYFDSTSDARTSKTGRGTAGAVVEAAHAPLWVTSMDSSSSVTLGAMISTSGQGQGNGPT